MLILPVSNTTIERVFSVMKIVKTRLHSKIEDSLITYIEKYIDKLFDDDSIIYAFDLKKTKDTT